MNIIKKSSRGYDLLPIESQLLMNRMIFLTEAVESFSCQSLIQQLLYLDMESHDPITILINSPGGEVRSGLTVLDVMKSIESPIRTVCIGCAASMGAILFEGASPGMRYMLEHSQLMLHGTSYGNGSFAGMKSHEILKMSNNLTNLNEEIAKMLCERTGMELEKVHDILSEDSFFDAKEAIELNLADHILDINTFRKELMCNE